MEDEGEAEAGWSIKRIVQLAVGTVRKKRSRKDVKKRNAKEKVFRFATVQRQDKNRDSDAVSYVNAYTSFPLSNGRDDIQEDRQMNREE
ncbi:hypothetical protein G5I_11576 [Acromyrmex echinatior]|uniref:Uncharacterized protein n=1 Tax=Acromyrmex echinatior TaxID=103372 RepID=F4WZZ7_ACREC|nr:hypothetical protein G5I_11576 [Acromyrmex echinatior]